jgi:hypothetical protein
MKSSIVPLAIGRTSGAIGWITIGANGENSNFV